MAEVGGDNCESAWRAAVQYLLQHDREMTNLLVTIDDPTRLNSSWLADYDPRSAIGADDRIKDVVNTVFPFRLAARFGADREGLYSHYLGMNERARHYVRNRGAWGTYFQRLINFDGNSGVNQLERVITKLATWDRRATAALVFHTSAPTLDSPRTRGGPCWQFGELLWHRGDVVDFVVVYRNHDYCNKALGNFVALGQLLNFICSAAGKRPGKLVCHSVHAYFDESEATMNRFARLPI